MTQLTASDLMSLEQYARERADFRAKVLEHKKTRQVALGPNATLYFEDELTIRYPDIDVRKRELSRLIGVEDKVWVQVDGHDKVYAIADEDLERDTDEKTSSVHFMRFELNDEMVQALKGGVGLAMGVDHENLDVTVTVPDAVRASLVNDLA